MLLPLVVDGRYRLDALVGRGNRSEVYRGRDLRLGREVAVKVLRADLAGGVQQAQRFVRRAHYGASLVHPGIAAVYDGGSLHVKGTQVPYVVMEFIAGQTLHDLLAKTGPLSVERAVAIAVNICGALAFAHARSIVHGELGIRTVMLADTGAVKVTGFGMAHADADERIPIADISIDGLGSEAAGQLPARDVDVDVRAAAAVLAGMMGMMGAPMSREGRSNPVTLNPADGLPGTTVPQRFYLPMSVPSALAAVLDRAARQDPADRYRSVAQLQAELTGRVQEGQPMFLGQEPEELLPAEPDAALRRSVKVRGFAAGAAFCLLLLAGAVFLTMNLTHSARAVPQVATPQLQDLTADQAQKVLAGAGLTLGRSRSVQSATVPAGDIAGQDPSAGTPIGQGKAVSVDVSVGITPVRVPDLTLLTSPAARKVLAAANLSAKVELSLSTIEQKDTVIAQQPAPGALVIPGSAVSVRVGRGPDFTTVPDGLAGLDYGHAAAKLAAAGLIARRQVVPGTTPVGTVVRVLGPAAGVRVQAGSPVTLQVSNERLFLVPDLTGKTPETAAAQLVSLGWTGTRFAGFRSVPVPSTDPTVIGLIASDPAVAANGATPTGTPASHAQYPAAGALVDKSTPFVVAVFAKAQITVPSFVVGFTSSADIRQQQGQLGAVNWTITIGAPAAAPESVGTFLAIDAAAGSRIAFDTPVNITVAGPIPAVTPPSTSSASSGPPVSASTRPPTSAPTPTPAPAPAPTPTQAPPPAPAPSSSTPPPASSAPSVRPTLSTPPPAISSAPSGRVTSSATAPPSSPGSPPAN